MPFLIFSNADIQFLEKELTWRTYTTKDALPRTRWLELLNKNIAKVMFDEIVEAFVVHVTSLNLKITVNLARKTKIALLLAEKVIIPAEYTDFVNVFLKELAEILPERTDINKYAIELKESKQPPYKPIYTRGPIELEILMTYIETNLANDFIRPSKLPPVTLILFVCKPNGSLWLCVDYQGLNNLTIKNQYPLLLISESLDRLR